MATLTPVAVTASGTAITYTAASAGGDTIANAKGATLRVDNGSGADITVTFAGAVPCSQGVTHASLETVTVTAGTRKDCPVPSGAVDASTGDAAVTYSAVTSVTVAAVYQ